MFNTYLYILGNIINYSISFFFISLLLIQRKHFNIIKYLSAFSPSPVLNKHRGGIQSPRFKSLKTVSVVPSPECNPA